jgi:hypothetical protein
MVQLSGKSVFNNSISFVIGFLVLVFLSGCSAKTAVVAKEDESQILKKRAMEYWDLMTKINPRNAEKIYQIEAPAFREKVHFVEYTNRFRNMKYFEADIQGINIEGEKAKVTVLTTSQAMLPMTPKKLRDTYVENWVKTGGTWYHFPREWAIQE